MKILNLSVMLQKMPKLSAVSSLRMVTLLDSISRNSISTKSIIQLMTKKCVLLCMYWQFGGHFSLVNYAKFTLITVPWCTWRHNRTWIKDKYAGSNVQLTMIAKFCTNWAKKILLLMPCLEFKLLYSHHYSAKLCRLKSPKAINMNHLQVSSKRRERTKVPCNVSKLTKTNFFIIETMNMNPGNCLFDILYRKKIIHDNNDLPIAGHPGFIQTYAKIVKTMNSSTISF